MADLTITGVSYAEILRKIDSAVAKGTRKIGSAAENYAKKRCPVDTGNLRNSIEHDSEDDGYTTVIGSQVHYAPYVEYGTGIYAENGKGRKTPWHYQDDDGVWHFTHGMSPQPYLRPALEEHLKEYKDIYIEELRKI